MSEEKAKVFEVVTDEFTRAVKWASKLTQNKDNALISIKIENGSMVMSSFNGVNASKSKSDVTQKFDGELEFHVNGSMLTNSIKSIKDAQIKCSVDGRTLTIKSSKAKFALPITMPRTNKLVLPPMPSPVGKVDSKEFKTLLGHAIAMTSDDASTPALTTVHMEISPQNKTLKLMATDRYKLVIRTLSYVPSSTAEVTEDFSIDVEARSLKTMLADLNDEDALTLYASASDDNRQLGIATSTQVGMVALKDVTPLKFDRFAAMSHSFMVVFKRAELVQAINVTKPLIEGAIKTAKIVVDNETMTLVSPMTDVDCGLETSNLEEEMTVTMNLDYLGSMISAGKSEFAAFGIDTANKPVIIHEMVDSDTVNKNFFSLAMPVRG